MSNTTDPAASTSFGLARPTAFDRASGVLRRFVMEIVLVALCAFLTFKSPYFLTADNLLDVLRVNSFKGMIALGMTMVIIAGEIDLSVGSAVAFSGCLAAALAKTLTNAAGEVSGGSIAIAMIVPLIILPLVGVLTGVLRVYFRVPTFITTLALLTILLGAAQLVTNGISISTFPEWYSWFGSGRLIGIPVPAVVFLLAFVLVQFLMSYTTFGRSVYAVGGNAEAARLSGINVNFIKIAVMAIVSFLAGLSGLMNAANVMSGNPQNGLGWELDVISAVIIGGTSLMGGAGRVWGTLMGVVFLGVVVNGMTLLNVDEFWKNIVRGSLILIAVLINVGPARKR